MPRHVVGIVRIGTQFATFYNDARFDSKARQIGWEVEVHNLISEWVTIRDVWG